RSQLSATIRSASAGVVKVGQRIGWLVMNREGAVGGDGGVEATNLSHAAIISVAARSAAGTGPSTTTSSATPISSPLSSANRSRTARAVGPYAPPERPRDG